MPEPHMKGKLWEHCQNDAWVGTTPELTELIESVPDPISVKDHVVVEPSMAQTEIIWEAILTEMHQINEHRRKSWEDAKEAGETAKQSNEITAEAKGSNNITATSKTIAWWALVVSG